MRNRENLVELTKNGYDKMAKDWAGTRMNFWTELTSLVTSKIKSGDRLLDLGCGNARFYREVQDFDIEYFGSDISEGLIAQAKKYHPFLDLRAGDARHTDYQNNFFNIVVSFAVIHHFPGKKSQQQFFDEVYRVLEPGGVAIITSWDIWKTRKKKIFSDYIKYKPKDFYWNIGDTIMNFTQHSDARFVHAFTKNSLLRLSKKSGFKIVKIENIKRASKKGFEENIVLVLKK